MRQLPLFLMLSVSAASLASAPSGAKELTVLAEFTKTNGSAPETALLAGANGAFFGTTIGGGSYNYGTAFELVPPAPGQKAWTESVIANFNVSDAANPHGTLIADAAGNLYGTSFGGGTNGDGTVYELSPPAPGQTAWTETILYSFDDTDGRYPIDSLLFDKAGNLYGAAEGGGPAGNGNVFELSPPAAGQTAWTETVLVSFTGFDGAAPGANPRSNLIADKSGNLYGTTMGGGSGGRGVVFALHPPAAGKTAWTETSLFVFNADTTGEYPFGGVIADKSGNLYGTTMGGGGTYTFGSVYELSPPVAGQTAWTATTIFAFNGTDGYAPLAGLIADKAGNLYGTTSHGGTDGIGTVFKLSPPAPGQTAWTETILSSLTKKTGGVPMAGLAADKAGHLYGTATFYGTPFHQGTVFEAKP